MSKTKYQVKQNRFIVGICLTLVLVGMSWLNAKAQKGAKYNRVIAHRGAWKNTNMPQNSIASLQEAIKLGCYGSEFDVHLSADGGVYLSHDHEIQGVDIERATEKEISGIKLKNGEALPRLEDFLKSGKGQKTTRLVLEIKASRVSKEKSLELTRKCVDAVKALKMRGIVDYISFDYDVCKLVKELDSKAHVEYLTGDKAPSVVAGDRISGLDYNLRVYKSNENWIKEAQALKMSVNVWTVNSEDDMKWFIERKVSSITTDEPEKLLQLLK